MVARGKFAASAEQAQNGISCAFSGGEPATGCGEIVKSKNESKELW
jgi:hypothetical protein